MAVNDWCLWEWLGFRKKKEEKVDVLTDLRAIIEFLRTAERESKNLKLQFEEMLTIHKESKIIHESHLKVNNLRKQIEVFDHALERYQHFETDAAINGERTKKIAKVLIKEAEQEKQTDLLERIKKESHWTFNW
ncbi:hypothetical protein J4417_05130 [Candidatus Woesearchaeota archaeon]|nr:hypothetical protein [Candidatus Woesearchaeota archaeon]